MARELRIGYPRAIYPVMSRGDRREPIFRDDRDRTRFVETLAEACSKTAWQVHAYCLMSNHFHLVIETPHGNLVAGMKWFLGTFTSRFNRRHKLFGHLFSGRYKALIVDGSADGYLRTVGKMEQGVGEHQSWDGKRETDEQKAERIVAEELRKRRWAEGTLRERRKTDAEKVKLAQRLRQETVMTLDWIAERLEMGCRHTLANCLKAARVTNNRD